MTILMTTLTQIINLKTVIANCLKPPGAQQFI